MSLKRFEDAVVDAAREVLDERNADIARLGVRCTMKPLCRDGRDSTYTSELAIDFADDSGIVDVLEFELISGGRPSASLEEIVAWLREAVEDVLGRLGQESDAFS